MNTRYDIIIIGGGAVGALLALALKDTSLQVLLVEKQEQQLFATSERSLILSLATQARLEEMGVWTALKKHTVPVLEVQVSMQHHFGATRFTAEKQGIPCLGYAVAATALLKILYHQLSLASNVTLLLGTEPVSLTQTTVGWHVHLKGKHERVVSGSLLVAADGGHFIPGRLKIPRYTYHYGHVALTCSVYFDRAHRFVAYERFTQEGAIAILPFGEQKATLVWSVSEHTAQQLLQLEESPFIQELQAAFGYRCGKIKETSQRLAIPLKMELAENQVATRALLLGNSAHLLHPVAAQGLNLSMRDVTALAEVLLKANENGEDIGHYAVLHRYVRMRLEDQHAVIAATDFLARYLANRSLAPAIRAFGLLLTELVPAMKEKVTTLGLGLSSFAARELTKNSCEVGNL